MEERSVSRRVGSGELGDRRRTLGLRCRHFSSEHKRLCGGRQAKMVLCKFLCSISFNHLFVMVKVTVDRLNQELRVETTCLKPNGEDEDQEV